MVNYIPTVACHFCQSLPAALTQPEAHLLADPASTLLTGSPLMYHARRVGGLDLGAEQVRCAVSPTWYCCRGLLIDGPDEGKSERGKFSKLRGDICV